MNNFQFSIFELARKERSDIFNFQKLRKINGGYTLIELVVVMTLLLVVGALIVGILSSTIRGIAKSKITNDLGQNGNYALSVITDIVLNSQNFTSMPDATGVPVSSCTPLGISAQSITVTGFDGGVSTLLCNDDTGMISSNSASLLDTTRVKLVRESCMFTCFQADPYSSPRIDVTFQLVNANGGAGSTDTQGVATFNTSLSLRNKSLKQ